MSRQLNPSQVWSQVPVASRTVEVNTKTGFSLTAGSYSVRASSSQQGLININSAANATATVSSVTVTRAHLSGGENSPPSNTDNYVYARVSLTAATSVYALRVANIVGGTEVPFDLMELF